MGTVLSFSTAPRSKRRTCQQAAYTRTARGEVIIFPGIRMERHSLDLGARIGRKVDGGLIGAADRDHPGRSI